MKIIKKLLLASLLLFSVTISGFCINYNIGNGSQIRDVEIPSFLYSINIGTGPAGSYDLSLSTTSPGSDYGLKFSTSIYAPAFYGNGEFLTGVTQDHAILLNLQGGSVGGVTNSDNVTFISPSNYNYNASSITVSGGSAIIAGTGSSASNGWEYITPSSYTYNSSSITVTGGVAKLLGSSAAIDLEAYWKMDEALWNGTPGEVIDSSVNSNDGEAEGGATTTAGGIFGNLGIFDGIDDNVSIPHNASISFETTDSFSFQCWMKTDDAGSYDALISKQQVSGAYGINVQKTSSGKVRFNLVGSAGSLAVDSTNIIDDDAIHHVIITYDGGEDISGVHIYIDGNDETLSTVANALSGSIVTSIPFRLADREALNQTFDGFLDEVAIWSRELSLSEVTSLYNSGSGLEINFYSTDNPDIETDFGWVFPDAINAFAEIATKPVNTEIKYQISDDNGVTYKYWAGAIWSVSDGTYAQASTAADINTNISTLASSGVLKVKAFLHTSDLTSTPELDSINVASGIIYQVGSFDIEMNDDIQPVILSAYLTATETVITPSSTTILYQFSINSGVSYNGSWLTESELESALIGLSPAGDGNDTIRFKFQLTTTDNSVTPEIDNLNITTDGGTGLSELFHLSSGTYHSLIDLNAQLDQLHTDGSPTFSEVAASTIAAVNFYGDGENITNVDAETLDSFDSTYFAIKDDVISSTDTLQVNIDSEEAERISEDALLADATTQLQLNIDSEETARLNEDALLGNSTGQLQIDLDAEEAARVNEDTLLGNSTGQLLIDLTTETATRISEDNLLANSTTQLQIDLDNEESARIAEDVLLGNSTGQLLIDLDEEIYIRGNEISSLTTTYLQTPRPGYTFVIGTYTQTGTTHIANGTTANFTLDSILAIAQPNDSIGFIGGTTYYFNNVSTVTANNITISSVDGTGLAILSNISGIPAYDNEIIFLDNCNGVVIKNLIFDGTGSDGTWRALSFKSCTSCTAKDILFRNIKAHVTAPNGAAFYGLITGPNNISCQYDGLVFDNCDTQFAFNDYSQYSTITDIRSINGGSGSMGLGGYYSSYSNIYSRNSTPNPAINLSGYRSMYSLIYITDCSAGAGIYSTESTINGIYVNNVATQHGVHVAANGNTITNIGLHSIGTGTANTKSGIYVDGDYNGIAGVKGSGTMDKYLIDIAPSANGTQISIVTWENLAGNVDIYNNLGTNTSIVGAFGNSGTIPNQLAVDTTFYADVTVKERLHLEKMYHAYGGFEDQALNITVDAGVWTSICNISGDLWNLNESDGFTIDGCTITIVNAGDYSGSLALAVSAVTGKDFHVRVYNITQAAVMGRPMGVSTTGTANETNIATPIYVEANAGDEIVFQIMSADGTNPEVDDGIFILKYLHD